MLEAAVEMLQSDTPASRMQTLVDGFQHEQPDYWLNFGNPWEIERLNVGYTIKFYGYVSASEDQGRQTFEWIPGDSVSLPLQKAHMQPSGSS